MSGTADKIESTFLARCGASPTERRRAIIGVASALPKILREAHVPPTRRDSDLDAPQWLISGLFGPATNDADDPELIRSELVVALRPAVSPGDNRGILSVYEGRCDEAGSFIGAVERTLDISDAKALEALDNAGSAVQVEPMSPAFLYRTDLLIPRLASYGANHRLAGVDEAMIAAIAVPAVVNVRSL
jgi:hypothetical protein